MWRPLAGRATVVGVTRKSARTLNGPSLPSCLDRATPEDSRMASPRSLDFAQEPGARSGPQAAWLAWSQRERLWTASTGHRCSCLPPQRVIASAGRQRNDGFLIKIAWRAVASRASSVGRVSQETCIGQNDARRDEGYEDGERGGEPAEVFWRGRRWRWWRESQKVSESDLQTISRGGGWLAGWPARSSETSTRSSSCRSLGDINATGWPGEPGKQPTARPPWTDIQPATAPSGIPTGSLGLLHGA